MIDVDIVVVKSQNRNSSVCLPEIDVKIMLSNIPMHAFAMWKNVLL